MATNENLIPIPGRLHSVATEGHVAGADEIYDDTQQKDQETINSELIAAVGTGGSVDSRIAAAVNVEKTRAEAAESALDGRVDTLEDAVGTGGSVDERIAEEGAKHYLKEETYNKSELNNMITTPNQEYVSVTATAQTTAVTDVLPATGAADTTYRVGNWDGTQYNDSVFSEYAWNGSTYIKLSTKSQVGEVYDISVNHADTKYADLAAALGTNGANIPQSLRKGGMSVKFVQSSDNKYVQYRLMNQNWSTVVTDWQGVDDEPIVESDNLIKSSGVAQSLIPIKSVVGGYFLSKSYNLSSSQGVYEKVYVNIKAGTTIKININSSAIWKANKFYIYFSSTVYLPTSGSKTITLSDDIEQLVLGLSSSDVTQAGDCQLNFEIIGDLDSRISQSETNAKKFASDLDKYSSKFPFTTNSELNRIIKELYLKHITKENIGNVYMVRVYNGYYTQSGNYLYGISIYITGLSYSIELYDSVTSPYTNIPSLYIKGQGDRWYGILDVSNVNNGEYKDFEGAVLNTYCLDSYYSPSIQLYINNPAKCERFPISDNVLLNSIVRELWVNGVTSAQLSNAYKVRIYNGFKASNNKYLYGITIYITGLTYTIDIIEQLTEQQSVLPTYIVKGQDDRWKAILNLSLVPSGEYMDVGGVVLNTTVLNINYSPTIIALDIKKETGTFAKFTPSNNNTFNNIVKELFLDIITSAQLESIVMIRIYNCAAINNKYHSGFTLYNSDYSYTIDAHKSFDTLSEAEEFISSPVIVTGPDDRIQAVIDWDKVTKGSYLDIRNFALYPICRNINFWESLKQHGTLGRLDVLEEDNHAPYFKKSQFIPYNRDKVSPLVYVGDTKSQSGFINNAVSYPNGEIIACRQNGTVVKIATDGTETTLLTIQGASEWRLCWMDSNMNVYVSPHNSFDRDATLQATDRGLYKLAYSSNTFVKVLSLYNPSSLIPTEAEENDDTIWTMTEDRNGNLYAGVYAHTIHANPSIYKSTDGGNTWSLNINFTEIINFRSGRHIHAVEYNKYDNCLYAIIGEINNIAKSDDYGETWTATGWVCEGDKGTTLLAVSDGLLVGSDSGYSCIITKIYADKTIKTVGKMWANIVFAMRRSDLTGYLYALTRVDSSVSSLDYYPSAAAVGDAEAIQEWKESSPSHLSEWEEYNDYAKNIYPDDAERPHDCAILISKDNGETWEILKKIDITYGGAAGFIMAGQFINGECVLGFSTFVNGVMHFVNPYIISEGKHRFTNDGKIDLSGDIFVKTNTSDKVTP